MPCWAVSLVAISIALSASGNAKDAPPAAAPADLGFWGILVKPNAHWVLKDVVDDDKSSGHRRATVTVETYDLRTVGTARVGRLRWTVGKAPFEQCGAVCLHRVAVTPAGLYFIDDDATDEKILEALKTPPGPLQPAARVPRGPNATAAATWACKATSSAWATNRWPTRVIATTRASRRCASRRTRASCSSGGPRRRTTDCSRRMGTGSRSSTAANGAGDRLGHHEAGTTLTGCGHLREAIAHLTQACDLDPASVEARVDLGTGLRLAGRPRRPCRTTAKRCA